MVLDYIIVLILGDLLDLLVSLLSELPCNVLEVTELVMDGANCVRFRDLKGYFSSRGSCVIQLSQFRELQCNLLFFFVLLKKLFQLNII